MKIKGTKKDKEAWVKWLAVYGADKFYDSFINNSQGALSTCVHCHQPIALDIVEGGGVPDWGVPGPHGADYGCAKSPDTCEEGTGSHFPERAN